jgi:hypothetical protein
MTGSIQQLADVVLICAGAGMELRTYSQPLNRFMIEFEEKLTPHI